MGLIVVRVECDDGESRTQSQNRFRVIPQLRPFAHDRQSACLFERDSQAAATVSDPRAGGAPRGDALTCLAIAVP
jgi:hypothetical protein